MGSRAVRVLMLTDYFPPHRGGGVEQVVSDLVDGLSGLGHEVAVLTLRTRGGARQEVRTRTPIFRLPAVDLSRWLGIQAAYSPLLVCALRRAVRAFQPDIVHAHNLYFRTTEAAAFPCVLGGAPLVLTVHLAGAEGGGMLPALLGAYDRTVGRMIFGRCSAVVAVSEAVARHVRSGFSTGEIPVSVIPNATDLVRFHPAGQLHLRPFRVLFAGRLVPNKGPMTLVAAVTSVLQRHPSVEFLIAGTGPQDRQLRRYVENAGLSASVKFLGHRDDMPELMRTASMLARPSTMEGMPLTVLEAMASGLPVVATRVGGTEEVVEHGVNGYLIAPDSPEQLAAAILSLADDPALAGRMGRSGREKALQRPGMADMVSMNERVYGSVLAS